MKRRLTFIIGAILVVLAVGYAAWKTPVWRHDAKPTTKQQVQVPTNVDPLAATRDSLEWERESNWALTDSINTIAADRDTMYAWFRNAYQDRDAARESLATFVAATDSLKARSDSLGAKLDQATSVAWVLAHGKEVASRDEARRTARTKLVKHDHRKVKRAATTVAVQPRIPGHGTPIRPGLRQDGDINPH